MSDFVTTSYGGGYGLAGFGEVWPDPDDTPDARHLSVTAERRVLEVDPEVRMLPVAADGRELAVATEPRTVSVKPPDPGGSSVTTFTKDPDAVLDYVFDWSAWLGEDTIVTGTATGAGVTVDSVDATTTTVTAWVSGGVAGVTGTVTCQVVTTDGRTDDRKLLLVTDIAGIYNLLVLLGERL